MCSFSHDLMTRSQTVLAPAIYFIALKTLEQVNRNFVPEELLQSISRLTNVSEEEILAVGR